MAFRVLKLIIYSYNISFSVTNQTYNIGVPKRERKDKVFTQKKEDDTFGMCFLDDKAFYSI